MLHTLLLAGEIFVTTVAGLITLSVMIATLRAMIAGTAKVFNISTDVAKAEKQAAKEGWLHRSLVAFDIAFNVIVLRGQEDETISTHCWRAQQEGKTWGKWMCLWLDGFQADHGIKAASGDLERAQSRVTVLNKLLNIS